MYLCIPKKPELINGNIYHSYNNYSVPISVNEYNFHITDTDNQIYLFYIIDVQTEITNNASRDNRDLKFFIFKEKRILFDDIFNKITIDNDEYNIIKCIGGWFCETINMTYMFRDNMLRIFYKKSKLFESNIKNLYPHGLCTEYVSNKIKFIRLYKMGVARGYGTEYSLNETNTKKYVGEFDNNVYHGEGEYFYPSGNLQYKGEFKHGSFYKGIEYYDYNGGIKYEGEFMNNKYNGQGVQYYNGVLCNANIKGKKKYEGAFVNGLYHGEGIKYNNKNGNIQYKGVYSNGLLNGQVLEYNQDGILIYNGKYLNDYKNGSGTEYVDEKISFKGEYVNGIYHGVGTRYSQGGFSLGTNTYKNGNII